MGLMKRFLTEMEMDKVKMTTAKTYPKPAVVDELTRTVKVELTSSEFSACFREAIRHDQLPGAYIRGLLLDKLEMTHGR